MITTILLFLLVLSVLVFVHEAGHFFAAKRLGVGVEEFGFGFPPRLFGWKRGETIYSVNAIPLGGFVRLRGETGGARDERSFAAQSIPRRLVIIAAGVVMNLILAAVLFSVGFAIGIPQEVSDQLPAGARVRDRHVLIVGVLPGQPAERSGILPGDEIVSVEGAPITELEDFRTRITARGEQPTNVVIRREDEEKSVALTPVILAETGKPGIGVGLAQTGLVSYPWYRAPLLGVQTTARYSIEILKAFGGLIGSLVSTGKPSVDVSGPVGIAVITGRVAELGPIYLLQFVALLSLNLGIINILPIPALDGGRVFFLAIERARGRTLSPLFEERVHQIGFALLLLLVAFVTFYDILRLFR